MSLLLDISRNRNEINENAVGEYDLKTQVWSTVRDVKDISDAIPVFMTGGTSQSGTTATPPNDRDDDDTTT